MRTALLVRHGGVSFIQQNQNLIPRIMLPKMALAMASYSESHESHRVTSLYASAYRTLAKPLNGLVEGGGKWLISQELDGSVTCTASIAAVWLISMVVAVECG
jgi:hypothetical protein